MFRSKRSSLVKRLWKYKLDDEARGPLQASGSESEHTASSNMSPLSSLPSLSSSSSGPAAVSPRPRSAHFWPLSSFPLTSSSSTARHSSSSSSSSGSPTSPQAARGSDDLDHDVKAVAHAFFKRLKEEQLENLVHAMESRGGEVTPCVPVSKTELRQHRTAGLGAVSPHILCCRVFRWPGLRSDTEMRRLPSCKTGSDDAGGGGTGGVVCCNPYHWSVVVKIDESPIQVDQLIPRLPRSARRHGKGSSSSRIIDTSPGGVNTSQSLQADFPTGDNDAIHTFISNNLVSSSGTTADNAFILNNNNINNNNHSSSSNIYEMKEMSSTGGQFSNLSAMTMTSSSSSLSTAQNPAWCTVAYWELRERVGRLFPVSDRSLHIFQQLPRGDGMCLGLLQQPTAQDSVRRTREKIGYGVVLSREAANALNPNVGRLQVLRELEADMERERERKKRRAKLKAKVIRDKERPPQDEANLKVSEGHPQSKDQVASDKELETKPPHTSDWNQDVSMGGENSSTLLRHGGLIVSGWYKPTGDFYKYQRLCSNRSLPSSSSSSSSMSTSSSSPVSLSPSSPLPSSLAAPAKCACAAVGLSSRVSLPSLPESLENSDPGGCSGCNYSADDNGYWTLCPTEGSHSDLRQTHHHHHGHPQHHLDHPQYQHCVVDRAKALSSLPTLESLKTTATVTAAAELHTAISTTSSSALPVGLIFSSPTLVVSASHSSSSSSSSSSSLTAGLVTSSSAAHTERTRVTFNENTSPSHHSSRCSCCGGSFACPSALVSLSTPSNKVPTTCMCDCGPDREFIDSPSSLKRSLQSEQGVNTSLQSCNHHANFLDLDSNFSVSCQCTGAADSARLSQTAAESEYVSEHQKADLHTTSMEESFSPHHPHLGCEYRTSSGCWDHCGLSRDGGRTGNSSVSCSSKVDNGLDSIQHIPSMPRSIPCCEVFSATASVCSNQVTVRDSQTCGLSMDYMHSSPSSEKPKVDNKTDIGDNRFSHKPHRHHHDYHHHHCPHPDHSQVTSSSSSPVISASTFSSSSLSPSSEISLSCVLPLEVPMCFSPQLSQQFPSSHITDSSTVTPCSTMHPSTFPPPTCSQVDVKTLSPELGSNCVACPSLNSNPNLQINLLCDSEGCSFSKAVSPSPSCGSVFNLGLPSNGCIHDCHEMSFIENLQMRPAAGSSSRVPDNVQGCDNAVRTQHTTKPPPVPSKSTPSPSSTSTSHHHHGRLQEAASVSAVSSNSEPSKHQETGGRDNVISKSCQGNQPNKARIDETTASTTTTHHNQSLQQQHQEGEVWAYNTSEFPIFVNSPTLDDPDSPRSLVVKKVPPGHCIKIFDYARAELLERTEARSLLLSEGPFDARSVRISMAKGWGPSYARQFITSCPCWLEVLLGPRGDNSRWVTSSVNTASGHYGLG
ncbi:mothers against decapentaplegic homolog [Elysia marginata]|uniref:Mothers against decapentaplegic homolog n=1 Tax=Elysia marginata TaxID=1093978 RepID=A0AAV4ICA9_9GAST|nr:mothers against decapentaplegic homolog [Elysia marginata]